MAQNGETQGHFDLKAHEATYGKVIGLLKWGTAISLLLGAFVVYLIAG